MEQAALVIWLIACVVSVIKGRGKLVAASVIGGVIAFAVSWGIWLDYAFTGDPPNEALVMASSLGVVAALAAPVLASMRLAKPWSRWATTNYDHARLRLATGRFLEEADRRGWAAPDVGVESVMAPPAAHSSPVGESAEGR